MVINMAIKIRVTYSVGTDPEKITEVVEANTGGDFGAMHVLREMYPNKQITIHSYQEIH